MNNENKTMNKKLNKKYLKIGSFSMVMTAVVLAAVILLNLFVAEIPSTYTKYDLSSLQLYSISEETEQILSGVEEDVNVYILTGISGGTGEEDHALCEYALALFEKM